AAVRGDPSGRRGALGGRRRSACALADGSRTGGAPGPGHRRDRRGCRVRAVEPAGVRGQHAPLGERHHGGERGALGCGSERRMILAAIDWVEWALMVGRVVVIFAALLVSVMLVIWIERKVVADMQMRVGPNRAGPAGILITLADGIKLFFKEGVMPVTADAPVYLIAPIASMVPAMLAFAVIPFGPGITLFGRHVPFQISDLDVGILWILAMASLAVFGVVLAGWSSGSNYPLLGAIGSSAKMIIFEVGMSLGLVAVLLTCGTLTMSQIVAVQGRHFHVTWLTWLPKWNLFVQLPAFLIYMTAALAET